MRALKKSIQGLIRDTKAATVIEYGLICALIVLAIMASLVSVGSGASSMWNSVSHKVQTAS